MSGYSFRPAKRENVALLIGIAGGTGSGKTFSAMRLATGLAQGKRFAVLDTENGRAKHYADQFQFDVEDLRAPFRPEKYADAITAAADAGYGVIVVDSVSHEHAGDGGLLDWHEEEFARMGGRDAVKMAAWIKPKMAHKQMVSRLLQVNAHVILCFRAEEKIEITKDAQGKTVIAPKMTLTGLDGWVPISEKNLPYELTLSVLMTAYEPGVPKAIKLQEQHRALVPLDKPITEDVGKALAAWAAGGEPRQPAQSAAASSLPEAAAAPDPGQVQYADALDGKLVTMLELLDIDGPEALVANHRAAHPLADHIAWLETQLARAQAKTQASAGAADPVDGGQQPGAETDPAQHGDAPEAGQSFAERARIAQERRASAGHAPVPS